MISGKQIKAYALARWMAFSLLFILLVLFGKQAMVWVVAKLYQFFIEGNYIR